MSAKDPATGRAFEGRKGRLLIAFSLTVAFAAIEVMGGLQAASLALLADATHMLISAAGLALVLTANRYPERRARPPKAHGYDHPRVLVVLTSCVFFLLLAVWILYEAYRRSLSLPAVRGDVMLFIAIGSLIINLVNMKLLAAESTDNPHVKSPWVSVLHDMPSSVEAIVAAIMVALTGWSMIDLIVGAAIGLYIIPRTWRLANQAIRYRT